MKIFTLLVFCFLLTSLSAQQIDVGTSWTYEKGSLFGPFPNQALFSKISVIGDTTITDEVYFKLSDNVQIQNLRIEDRKYYVFYEGQKHLLYDFNLGVGDLLSTYNFLGGTDSLYYSIDSVSILNINGVEVKVQHISYPVSHISDFGYRLIEGVGSDKYLFPTSGTASPTPGPIRCIQYGNGYRHKFTSDENCEKYYGDIFFTEGSVWHFRQWGFPSNNVTAKFAVLYDDINYFHLARINAAGETIPGSKVRLSRYDDKVFFIDEDNKEKLLFDFSDNLKVGDTVTYYLPPNANMYDISSNGGMEEIVNPYQYVILEIDSVVIDDGEFLRRYSVDPFMNSDSIERPCNWITEIIEGVGPTGGFMRKGCEQVLGGTIEKFRCYTSSKFNYREVTGNCDIVATDNINYSKIKIYPNPSSGKLNISSDITLDRIEVYDVTGTLINVISKPKEIDISQLKNGMYFLRLYDKDQQVILHKMMVKI